MTREKPKHCVVCTSTKDLVPYMGTKYRCAVCEKESRYPGNKK